MTAVSTGSGWGGINKFGFALVILGGPLLAFIGLLGVGIIALGLVLIMWRTYSVMLHTSTGTQQVLRSGNRKYIEAVVRALRAALADLRPLNSETTGPVLVRYDQVRGWLLFLCIVLTIIAPGYSLLTTVGSLAESGSYISVLPANIVALITMELAIAMIVIGLGIYAGVGLWRIRPGALKVAKAFLITVLIVTLAQIVFAGTLDVDPDLKEMILSEGAMSAIRVSIFFAIWFTYLSRSRRVRATYGGLESTEWQGELPIEAVYVCPSCSTQLELEEEELDRREFTCPGCGATAVL